MAIQNTNVRTVIELAEAIAANEHR